MPSYLPKARPLKILAVILLLSASLKALITPAWANGGWADWSEVTADMTPVFLYGNGATTSEKYALQFNATESFSKLRFAFLGSGTMTLSLYSWHHNYHKTLSEAPVWSSEKISIDRDGLKEIEIGPMASGNYVITITNASAPRYIGLYTRPAGIHRSGKIKVWGNHLNPLVGGIWYDKGSAAGLGELLEENLNFGYHVKVKPDQWHAVDGLGRTLSTCHASDSHYNNGKGVGPVKNHKYVGVFYWTTSGYWSQHTTPKSVSRLLGSVSQEIADAAKNDYRHPLWSTNEATTWFWDEPLLGYYSTYDEYVLRKHAELLADAGVDVLFFDCAVGTPHITGSYIKVFEVFAKARQQGVKTPQIAFVLSMGDSSANAPYLRLLYEQIYSKGLFKELWFHWEDKPLILAYKDKLVQKAPFDAEIINFFTYRRADGISWRTEDLVSPPGNPFWGWLATHPQAKYYNDGIGKRVEQITVGVAQNVDVIHQVPTAMNGSNVAGRSYSNGTYSYVFQTAGKSKIVNSDSANSVRYGINFQQQWDFAIPADPSFIFVTGWNEWTAGRYETWQGVTNAFPDQYNTEFSRDIEPSAGELRDHYYYQLAENIRRFKGASPPDRLNASKSIDLNGGLSQWSDISAFDHYLGSTWRRADAGYRQTFYKNDSMRNDIVRSKVAFDDDHVYFYVETIDNLTDPSGNAWMRLFIDADFTGISPHWEGFEFVINRINPASSTCKVERSLGVDNQGGWLWESVGDVPYRILGNVLQVQIPRSMLGMAGQEMKFNFKWSDNMQKDGDILDFYKNGDVAPGGRFTFHFDMNLAQE